MKDLPPIDFALTPEDRARASRAAEEIRAHRKRQNDLDAMQSLARWRGDQYRPRQPQGAM